MNFLLSTETASLALLLLLGPAFFRVWSGPTLEDRLLGIQALGTAGTALLLLLAQTHGPGLVDTALVMVLLSALALLTLTRMLSTPNKKADDVHS